MLFDVEEGLQLQGPLLLPGGEWVLYSEAQGNIQWSDARILARSLVSGEEKLLVSGGVEPRFVHSGHLTYARDGVLLAVAFDPVRVEVTGGAVTLLDGLGMPNSGGAYYDTYPQGDLLYFQAGIGARDNLRPAWYDLEGNLEVLAVRASGHAPSSDLAGQHAARRGPELAARVSWRCGSTRWPAALCQRLTPAGMKARNPVWSPDGDWVYFLDESRGGISRIRSDFTGTVDVITEDSGSLFVASISPDGSKLLVTAPEGNWNVQLVDIESGELENLAASPAIEVRPVFSAGWAIRIVYIQRERQLSGLRPRPGGRPTLYSFPRRWWLFGLEPGRLDALLQLGEHLHGGRGHRRRGGAVRSGTRVVRHDGARRIPARRYPGFAGGRPLPDHDACGPRGRHRRGRPTDAGRPRLGPGPPRPCDAALADRRALQYSSDPAL